MLTDSLFAINYIIPTNENVYVAAVQKGERAVGLYSYAEGKLKRVLEDSDAFVWRINVNPAAKQVVLNTYSQSELDKNMESNEGDEGIGTNTIWILDMQDGKIAKIAEVESGDMTNIGIKEEGEIYYNLAELRKLEDGKTDYSWICLDTTRKVYNGALPSIKYGISMLCAVIVFLLILIYISGKKQNDLLV